MNTTWLIKGARVVDPYNKVDEVADLFVHNGLISSEPTDRISPRHIIDASSLVLVPGLIDLHVHFREPGNTQAETIRSGSDAAARGGFTHVVTMPNTTPATDDPRLVAWIRAQAAETARVCILPSACITRERHGTELTDFAALKAAGAVALTDDGSTVPDDELMHKAMRIAAELDLPLLDHALDPTSSAGGVMHAGTRSSQLGLPGISSAAEIDIVKRDIELCRLTGCATHIQHLSTAGAAGMIAEARARGLPVTAEATPHHLALTDNDVNGKDPNYKMAPPLRTTADRDTLRDAVANGAIQAFATDHAPHTAEAKQKGFLQAPFGVTGLETAVGVTYTTMVATGLMSLADWITRWTLGPAAVLNLPPPHLAVGQPANLTVLDLNNPWQVEPDHFLSLSSNSPFIGRPLTGRAIYTFLNGRMTWNEPY